MAITVLVLVLYALAVARVARFITVDKLAEPFRAWVAARYKIVPPADAIPGAPTPVHLLTYMVFCTACVSFWVAFLAAPAAIVITEISWWLWPFVALSASQITILLSRFESD